MRRLLAFTLAILALPSLASAQPLDPPDRFVVIRRDAWLYVEPKDDAKRVRALTPAEAGTASIPWVVYRWVGEYGGDGGEFVEIETTGDTSLAASGHCHDGEPRLDGMRLRFFVKRDDLSPVVTRHAGPIYPDGSRVSVRAGEPVVQKPKGRVLMPALGVEFTPPPKGSIGIAYVPRPALAQATQREGTVTGKLNGKDVTWHDVEVVWTDDKRGEKLVKYSRCVTVRLLVDPSSESGDRGAAKDEENDAAVAGESGAKIAKIAKIVAPPGTAVHHADGTMAGGLSRAWSWRRGEIVEKEGRLCWDHPVGVSEKDQSLALCIDRSAVTVTK